MIQKRPATPSKSAESVSHHMRALRAEMARLFDVTSSQLVEMVRTLDPATRNELRQLVISRYVRAALDISDQRLLPPP